jgi:hypothetical protein
VTLDEFIDALDAAGLDFQAEDVLDAFWLASCGRQLSLDAAPAAASRSQAGAGRADELRESQAKATLSAKGAARDRRAGRLGRRQSRVYAGGLPSVTDRTLKAGPVAIPAGRALGNRLALMRSLRPLCRRWPSRRDLELDEERTAEASAELGVRDPLPIVPVFQPTRTHWYDAEVVLEDDPVIELWDEAIRDFCQVLRDTGGFRQVRSWRLRVEEVEDIDSDAPRSVAIETPTGARLPSRVLASTGARRLIFFVAHGSSPLWLDGSYARVLAPWLRAASVVLLHMLPRERWPHTYLGDSHGECLAQEPGLPAAQLTVEPFWWRRPEGDLSALLRLPAVSFDSAAMRDWAAMQMARGRRSPIFLLDPRQPLDLAEPASGLVSRRDFERAVAQLREVSPEAFRLGVYLSPSYFTIPVARLIQEAKLGKTAHPSQLGELFLSGLVFAKAGGAPGATPDERYFGFWPQARAILMQALREEDARSIAIELEKRVSRHIEEISGRIVTFRGLVPREDGTYDLPEWAQPFATVANAMLGLSDGETSAQDTRETPPLAPPQYTGETRPQTIRATVRMYRQGFGDCFLLSLKDAGGPDYKILVNCGVVLGTPNAAFIMAKIAEDILVTTNATVDTLIITQALWSKVSGFVQAEETFRRMQVGDVLLGWWEDPNDALARKLRIKQDDHVAALLDHRSRSLGRSGSSSRAFERAIQLARERRFVGPSDPPLPLGQTGARLYCLGAPRDEQSIRKIYPGGNAGLDIAIELAGGDVLLFGNSTARPVWSSWRQLSWQVDGRIVAGRDLLARAVFLRTQLTGNDTEMFEREAMPLMPMLRIVAAPIDHATMLKKRWTPPLLYGIEQSLRSRGGGVLRSDADPDSSLPNVTVSQLWFEAVF